MPTLRQTVPGASQFDGTPVGGFFGFGTAFSNLKRSTRIVINGVSYTEVYDAGAPLLTDLWVRCTLPGGDPTDYTLLARGLADDMRSALNGNMEFWSCGRVLPREPSIGGTFWDIQVYTQNKRLTGMVSVDYTICPLPETADMDSRR